MMRVFSAAVFLVSFLFAAIMLRDWLPDVGKLAWFEENANQVEVVFVGSSLVYRQLDPAQFDEVYLPRTAGRISFNYGLPDMSFLETTYHAERILENAKPSLKWLVLEASHFDPRVNSVNISTRRMDAWHDWRRTSSLTPMLFQQMALAPFSWAPIEELINHWLSFAKNRANMPLRLSLHSEVVDEQSVSPQSEWRVIHGHLGRGFSPMQFRTGYSRPLIGASRQAQSNPPPAFRELVAHVEQLAAAKGVSILWLGFPRQTSFVADDWRALQRAAVIKYVLDLSDTKRFPPETWADRNHLNWNGAKDLTILAAQELNRLNTKP